MLSESLHPNRLVAGSFASPSRDLLQIGFHLYPLPNNAITGKAGDIGFIQRNGWFGRNYRQTVKLSDFVSHPHISIKCIFRNITEYLYLLILVTLTKDTSLLLFQISRSFFADSSIHACLFRSLLLRFVSVPRTFLIFFLHSGQYFDIAEQGTYSTPHTVQFLGFNAVHRFVGVICNSPTQPMNL